MHPTLDVYMEMIPFLYNSFTHLPLDDQLRMLLNVHVCTEKISHVVNEKLMRVALPFPFPHHYMLSSKQQSPVLYPRESTAP